MRPGVSKAPATRLTPVRFTHPNFPAQSAIPTSTTTDWLPNSCRRPMAIQVVTPARNSGRANDVTPRRSRNAATGKPGKMGPHRYNTYGHQVDDTTKLPPTSPNPTMPTWQPRSRGTRANRAYSTHQATKQQIRRAHGEGIMG